MANERTVRIEEIEKGQQDMQEKISQVTKMVMSLIKRKWITEDPSLQKRSTSWKNDNGEKSHPPLLIHPRA